MINYTEIRRVLAELPSDHDAAGQYRPRVEQIFTPEQHANALDPNTPVVVGARGAGKSFWAGVLEQDDTRRFASAVYPHIGLDAIDVRAGYTGFSASGVVTAETINEYVPVDGEERKQARLFWRAVVIRAARSQSVGATEKIKSVMDQLSDPERASAELARIDAEIEKNGRTRLITFDALDTWSNEWGRSSVLTDSLFEVIWSLRACRAIRAKVFIRPEQLNDEALKFVEMPKLRSGSVRLEWSLPDLYGMLYWRLSEAQPRHGEGAFYDLAKEENAEIPIDTVERRRVWRLLFDRAAQEQLMQRLAGQYMGKGNKKGKTYDWPYKHLADARGEVTPRSFIKLFVEAAKFSDENVDQVISPEGIRHGLREASKVRVDQLVVEYKWVKRALAPLAGLIVPCEAAQIYNRWVASDTLAVIRRASRDSTSSFLPPFPFRDDESDETRRLVESMERIGVFAYRSDKRIDMPDLFRVAARMLKKGGVPPT